MIFPSTVTPKHTDTGTMSSCSTSIYIVIPYNNVVTTNRIFLNSDPVEARWESLAEAILAFKEDIEDTGNLLTNYDWKSYDNIRACSFEHSQKRGRVSKYIDKSWRRKPRF